MKLQLLGLVMGAATALAGGAWAQAQVLVKCDSPPPQGQRYTIAGGWQPYPNPDRGVTISRAKGKFTVEVEGEHPYVTQLVFPIPLTQTRIFKVLGQNGVERFQLFEGPAGKPQLRHTITAGSDGSHVYNIRVTTLEACAVVSPDVVVSKPEAPGATP